MSFPNFNKRAVVCSLITLLTFSVLVYADAHTLKENGETYCKVVCAGPNSVTVSISVSEIALDKRNDNGVEYLCPILSGYRNNLELGAPAVLTTYFSMLTGSNPGLDIKIIEKEAYVVDNVLLYPSQPAPAINPDHKNEIAPFTKNSSLYESNADFPSSIAGIYNKMEYRGNYITSIWLSPMSYNPVTKQLTVYTKLKATITLKTPLVSAIADRISAISLLKNNAMNAQYFLNTKRAREIDDDDADDVIIITTDEFKEAADSLALWQRQKGYDVKVVSNSSWSSSNVASEVEDFYNQTTPKPGYMLIIGDRDDVPTSSSSEVTDLYYVCFGGSGDYVADMARGRISVSSASEATGVARKILKYEKTPPETESFYNTVISAAQFQTNDGSTERWAFTFCTETSGRHMKENYGYDLVRLYDVQNNGDPQYWDPSYVGYLSGNTKKPVPDDIQKPNYSWDVSSSDVIDAFDAGAFLAFHYDHGLANGWSTPSFTTTSVSQLANGDMLPVVYSINCSSGEFQNSCFAEAILNMDEGGAVGVVAATATTYAGGANGALIMGLVDASFPRNLFDAKDPVNETPRDTTYILGDIFNHGLIRHGECCSNYFELHSEIYHLFGDPTTVMWTAAPQDITATHYSVISFSDDTFDVSNLNITRGMASLVDKGTGVLAGKKLISGLSVTIPVTNFTEEGEAVLTITSHNYRPYMATITVQEQSGTHDPVLVNQKGIPIRMENRVVASVKCAVNSTINVLLYNLKGQVVYRHTVKVPLKGVVNLPAYKGLGDGIYMLNVETNGQRLTGNVIFFN